MTNPILPGVRQPYTDQGGNATVPFHAWCSAVDRALQGGTLSIDALASQFAELAAQINAIEPGLPLSTNVVGSPGIGVSGSLAAGAVILSPDHDLGAIEGLSTFGVAVRTATDAWTTRALTGTLDRITVTNGDGIAGDPTFDIAATYAGQTSITTLGTVTTGEWNATRITNAYLAQINSKRFMGRTTGGVGDVEYLSVGTVQGMLGVAAALPAMTLVGNNTGSTSIAQAALTVAEVQAMLGTGAGLTSSITNGDTTHAPSGDAVFDALALKAAIPKGYIDGLQLQWVSGTALTVSSGSAYIEASANIVPAPSAIAKTSLSLSASTWYHVYFYLNAGTPDIEIVTTAPVAYSGTARSKTGDTSRRYLGSIKTDASSSVLKFKHSGTDVFWQENTNAAPFIVLSAGTATTVTTVACSGTAPVTAVSVYASLRDTNTNASAYLVYGNSNQDFTLSNAAFIINVAPQPSSTLQMQTDSSQAIQYLYADATPAGNLTIRIYGYTFER